MEAEEVAMIAEVLLVIGITVFPQISIKGDVRVTARMPKHEDNRAYFIEWSCDGMVFGSRAKTMDGENEPAIIQFYIHPPIGEADCQVVGVITRVENGKVKYYKTIAEFMRR